MDQLSGRINLLNPRSSCFFSLLIELCSSKLILVLNFLHNSETNCLQKRETCNDEFVNSWLIINLS